MQRERVTRRSQAAMVVGWVSNTDAIFMGLIITLSVTLFVAARLHRSEGKNHQMQGDFDALQGRFGQVQGRVTDLRAECERLIQLGRWHINELKTQLSSLQSQSAEEKRQLEAAKEKLKGRLAALGEHDESVKAALAQAAAERHEMEIRLVSATEDRDRAQQQAKGLHDAEPGLHKELIGLKGHLRRVAVVFDTSGSMSQDGRWEHARGVVATWLEHLAISECALILFSTDAHVFPQDNTFLDVRGSAGEANRKRLLEQIKDTKPDGGTNTLLALQMAYQCPQLDTIILFTDGEPNNGESNQFDPEIAERIYALCRQHKDIPVNTVGLGNYFKPQLSGFLMKVAQETDGSFLGR